LEKTSLSIFAPLNSGYRNTNGREFIYEPSHTSLLSSPPFFVQVTPSRLGETKEITIFHPYCIINDASNWPKHHLKRRTKLYGMYLEVHITGFEKLKLVGILFS
jgi:hypothetical protein